MEFSVFSLEHTFFGAMATARNSAQGKPENQGTLPDQLFGELRHGTSGFEDDAMNNYCGTVDQPPN